MKIEATAMTNGSEGEIKKAGPLLAAEEFKRGWFSFRDMNQNRLQNSLPMLEIANKYISVGQVLKKKEESLRTDD
uniref:Uncharacterized protein n=1 Tax=Cucumis melo TaxID=3656 RepID=A0A9I9EMD9_CUCME